VTKAGGEQTTIDGVVAASGVAADAAHERPSVSPGRTGAGPIAEVLRVSMPLMLVMGGNLLLMLVDRIALSRYSEATLLASGPAVFTGMTIIMFVTGTVGVTRAFVAQAHGRGAPDEAAEEGALGVLTAVLLGIALLAAEPLISAIPQLSDRPAESVALESVYLTWSTRFGAVMAINMALASYLNGVRRTRVPMTVGLMGQVVGAFLAVALIFGEFGFPEMGMAGSGVATLAAVSLMTFGYLLCLPRGFFAAFSRVLSRGRSSVVSSFWRRFRRGAPSGGASGLEELGNTSFIWIAALLGPTALAANNVAVSINYVAIIPVIGLAVGCSILTGNAIGARDFAAVHGALRATFVIASTWITLVAVFLIGFPELLLEPFGLTNSSQQAVDAAVTTSRVLCLYAVAFMFAMIGAAVLESFGLTRFVLLGRIAVVWCVSIPAILVIALGHRNEPDVLPVIWAVYSGLECLLGVIYLRRIRHAVRARDNQLLDRHLPDPEHV